MTKLSKHTGHRRLLVGCLIAVVLVALGVFFIHKHSAPKVAPAPTANIKQLPQHKAANNGDKKLSSTSAVNQGGPKDNHGEQTATDNPSNQWVQSESGVITVKNPVNNSEIKSGDTLTGSATVDKIQYRLIDDQVGVVSQGFISVVNGNFSASVNFPSYAKTGRLDVFSSDSSGRETNEVQIPVRLGN